VATTTEAMASARLKPVVTITIPAISVPISAYRSVRMCRKLASMFRLRRLACES
jgi:hypothetical protein